ncbi:hypothetical protein [Phyllobacterium zundukense]|uniref:Uncharacterized protein n=1 Tax=Phyllobacterium zundukense TaxID=1867719 RepID=A0ACD4D7J2_9HYPH|nr:hypothetical protein [Phyllobacterium zundukense]UXN61714.1 hypothetical protein N8E88_16840 [Phyllobacterium zundukense]
MPLYVNTDDYHAALDQIVAAPSDDPLLDPRSRITIILGEVLDIWPDSIRDDCEPSVKEAA